MIPKIIHYCWFGGNPLPELAQKCIASWRKYLPTYEIKEWNESNFDVNVVPFTAQVAAVKKWGFIVDYIRAYVVYYYGGIYLDTDVEILKPLDDRMLQCNCFSGFESDQYIAPGLFFAGEKGCIIAEELMNFYTSYNFIKENGELDLTPSPKIFTNILIKYGLAQNNTFQELGVFTAYPSDYFCPKSFLTGKINITENTYSIHHYEASWTSANQKKYDTFRIIVIRHFGEKIGSIILFPGFLLWQIKDYGIKKVFQKMIKKISKK